MEHFKKLRESGLWFKSSSYSFCYLIRDELHTVDLQDFEITTKSDQQSIVILPQAALLFPIDNNDIILCEKELCNMNCTSSCSKEVCQLGNIIMSEENLMQTQWRQEIFIYHWSITLTICSLRPLSKGQVGALPKTVSLNLYQFFILYCFSVMHQ